MMDKTIIEKLLRLRARSMFEMLPAFRFKEGTYNKEDLDSAYRKGVREMEEAWHDAINELIQQIQS